MNEYLYRFMLFMTRFGLAIARSTGRDIRDVQQLELEEERYELLLFKATRPLWNEGSNCE